ncbi:MAG TPA: DUF1700 domain-containing protein [Methanoregulaceae archaeon]|nr:DUF1700 domain-containing protein [Methanoregulaceae archaeon]HRY74740.1 DUF1700 domain-containing protein [Methanoregulaceae archaeon]
MIMNEQEFIRILRSRLESTLPEEELTDIVADYAEHFRIGKADGRSEEDLLRSLGSPEDLAREIRATHLVKKAEDVKSCKNLLHAVVATLGLGLFNLVFVVFPFILLVVILFVIALVGVVCAIFGPVAFVLALLQVTGITAVAVWQSPFSVVFLSIGITTLGLLLVIGDFYLARFFYRIALRYLRWNISIITGTESIP